MHRFRALVIGAALSLAACGATASPPASRSGSASASVAPAPSSTAPSPAASAKPHVKILYGTLTGAHAFVHMAADKGFIEKYGVTAEAEYAISTTAIAALVSGQVQFTTAGAVDTIQAVTSGAPLKILAFNQATNPYGIFSQPAIKTVNELKGKTVAIGRKGDTSDLSLRLAFKDTGLNIDRDFNVREIGNSPARWAALTTRQVDAAILEQNQYEGQAQKAGLTKLISLSEQHIPYASGGLESNANFIKSNPDVVMATLKGLIDAGRFFENPANRDQVLGYVAADLKADNVNDPSVIAAYDAARQRQAISFPDKSGIEGQIEVLKTLDPAHYSSVTAEQVIDDSFMTQLRASGSYTDRAGA
ncbi:MAG TPA: ABC transporter substrate-binding protein [Chloroflexota bacterium]|nr:ABC transporter substrate-binding protein [Chloroflexota bacterium]